MFASVILFAVNVLLLRVPLTFDGRALYATHARFAIAGILALAAAGFWMARAGDRRLERQRTAYNPRAHTLYKEKSCRDSAPWASS